MFECSVADDHWIEAQKVRATVYDPTAADEYAGDDATQEGIQR